LTGDLIMIKKLFVVASLIAIMLSGCAGQGSTQTAVPSPSETLAATTTETSDGTDTPVPTPLLTNTALAETSAVLPTATFTPVIPQPINAADCTNLASFVADVTIPDNSNVTGGTIFTKTWRVRNTGTCTWGSGYTLTPYSDEDMDAPDSVPLNVTQPGEELDISLDLRQPTRLELIEVILLLKTPRD